MYYKTNTQEGEYVVQDTSRYQTTSSSDDYSLYSKLLDALGPTNAYGSTIINPQRGSAFRTIVEKEYPYGLGPMLFGRADEAMAGVVSVLTGIAARWATRQLLTRVAIGLAFTPYGWAIAAGVGLVTGYLVYKSYSKSFAPDTGLLDLFNNDPLILDLNHNNTIDLTSLPNSSVLFDMNLDGKLESTGWVGPQDGMLVLDRNDIPSRAFCFNALGTGGEEAWEGGVRSMNAFDYATAA